MNKINTRIVKFKFPRHAYVGHQPSRIYHLADFYEPMVPNILLREFHHFHGLLAISARSHRFFSSKAYYYQNAQRKKIK